MRERLVAQRLFLAARHSLSWFTLVLAFAIPLAAPTSLRALDFAAFYCAGEALVGHADPYRVMPLGACERRIAKNEPVRAGVVIPAPLPPYALGAFAVFARLPFAFAQHLFDLLSIGALAVSALALQKITRRPLIDIAYALAPLGWVVVVMGQTVLIILGSLTTAAYFLKRENDRLAAICVCGMMIDPHLGLPAFVSLFLCRPQARAMLLTGAGILLLISLAVVPLSISSEYAMAVIPLHAISEAVAATQISLTSLLTFVGIPDHIAIGIGGIQYAFTVALGILISRRFESPAGVVLIPSLSALIGGSFLHNYDLLLAIPTALLLWNRYPLLVALTIVAITPHINEVGGFLEPWLAIVSAFVVVSSASSPLPALLTATPLLMILIINPLSVRPGLFVDSPVPTEYAQIQWRTWEAVNHRQPAWPIKNVPDWTGTIILGALSLRASHGERRAKPFPLGGNVGSTPDLSAEQLS